MARLSKLLTPNTTAPLGTASDYLFLLRCDEGAAASDLVDGLGVRTMSQTANPGVVPSIFQPNRTTQGSRSFDGATQYAGRTHDADETIFQSAKFGIAFWYMPANTNAVARLIEFGEHSSAGAGVSNVQLQIAVDASQGILFRQQTSAGGFIDTQYDNIGANTGGKLCHYGASVEPDLDNPGKQTIRQYLNGECFAVDNNKTIPDGGSAARWIVGASRRQGSAVNAPGSFFNGSLQDIVFAKFTPPAEFFRALYANGIRDFQSDFGGRLFSVFTRVLVEDNDGRLSTAPAEFLKNMTDWNLCNIYGWNFLRSAEWGEAIDDAGMQATIKFHPRVGEFNLSPFIDNEVTGGSGAAYDNLLSTVLAPMKRIKIETATVPYLMTEDAADPFYVTQFDGFIQAIDIAADEVTVTAADKSKALQNTWIEPARDGQDRKYGSNAGTAVIETQIQKIIDDNDPAHFELLSAACAGAKISFTVFSTSTVNGQGKPHALLANDLFVVTGTANYNGTYTVDPSSTSTVIVTQETHAAVATEAMTGFLDAAPALSYPGRKPTLAVPTSPSWNVFEWNEPASKSVQQSLEDIIQQIGWRIAYRWDDNTFAYRLQLFDPSASPDLQSIVTGEILTFSRMSIKDDDTRNVAVVEYGNAASPDPTKERPRFIVSSIDVASVRANGRRYCRVSTGSDSLITRSAEATTLAGKITGDLSTPSSEAEIELKYDPTWEVGDAVSFSNEVFTDQQMPLFFATIGLTSASVVEVHHALDATKHRTKLVLRKFAINGATLATTVTRVNKWWNIINQKGAMRGRGLASVQTPGTPSVRKMGTINGFIVIRAFWQAPSNDYGSADLNRAWTITEVHCSSSIGFTPTASTLQALVAGTNCVFDTHDIGNTFVGGTLYYVAIVHRDRMGNRIVSPQTSFTA